MPLPDPVYDLCSVLKALHHNGVSAGVDTLAGTEGHIRAHVGGLESTFAPKDVRHIAGWLKRASVHQWGVFGIDWDKGNWEVRR